MSKIQTAIRLAINKPQKMIRAAASNGLMNFLPDIWYLPLVFQAETGYKLNLKNPVTYNEKLQWIKLYDRKPIYRVYADKYAVRDYVKKKLGEKYLIPLLGVYERVEDIDWGLLPDQFVLKCTHGSGSNIICKYKKQLDIVQTEKLLNQWMKKSWYWFGREWAYKNIKPRIICEQFLQTVDGKAPVDYKFMCFNGEPKLIQVHQDRFGNHTNDFYDIEWNKTYISRQSVPNSAEKVNKPETLNEMLNISKILSHNMPHARIDLYIHDNKVYFGEITLYPTSGFSTFSRYDDDVMLGGWINLKASTNEQEV